MAIPLLQNREGREVYLIPDEELDKLAKEAQREYKRRWDKNNRERINKYHREWRSKPENKKKIREYNRRYWRKKALEMLREQE